MGFSPRMGGTQTQVGSEGMRAIIQVTKLAGHQRMWLGYEARTPRGRSESKRNTVM